MPISNRHGWLIMNALRRKIKENEVVVSLPGRLFCCKMGFGMESYTVGSTIYGYYLDDKVNCSISSLNILVNETLDLEKDEELQKYIKANLKL